jgi:template-activating factor I
VRREHAIKLVSSERQAQALLRPVYEKRREIVKAIPSFWPVALLNNSVISYHAQHGADLTALNYLEDMWVVKSADEHRCFTIEFVRDACVSFFETVLTDVLLVFQRKSIFP